MKSGKMIMLLAAICLVCTSAILMMATVRAAQQQGQAIYSSLEIVGYASGLTGLFDPSTGKFFLYDANLENCVAVRQISELGKPMKRIKN
jgi:hypothetical protein